MPQTSKKAGNTGSIKSCNSAIESHSLSSVKEGAIPVAAIGASAGGLEPIELFFDSMPADSGCAFIIIQHLSPDFRSLMDELLARHSSMKIHRIEDGMQIEPNSIYLNTPRTVMTIVGNKLRVEKISENEAVYLPIDIFFQSLARDRGVNAIGLVLSGTGSDGTKGSQSIKNAGGNILVQEPETTRFDSMPGSVISRGFHNAVATPEILADNVQRLLNNETLDAMEAKKRLPINDPLADILSMLKHSHSTDFQQYKEATIYRRIERRAYMRSIDDIDVYRDLLSTDSDELRDLYADLLIEVTEFFRDPEAFEILKTTVLPELTNDLKDGGDLRVWVPGCASGEEAYSLAILLQEQARHKGIKLNLKIMATDIHERSMNQANSGIYSDAALVSVPIDLLNRYFDCADGQAQIKSNIRNMIFFSTHDVTKDPPFTRIDLISCRNLLIYLNDDAQEKVMNLLYFSLRKDGYLFLGPSEHIGEIAHEFDVVNEKWRVYKKRRDAKLLSPKSLFLRPVINLGERIPRDPNRFQTVADAIPLKRAHRAALEIIVERHAPAGFLLTDDGTIVHIFGDAGDLIPMQAGTFSKRVVDLIIPDLKNVVITAFDHSRRKKFEGFHREATVKTDGQITNTYEVTLSPLVLPAESINFLLLTIEDRNALEGEVSNPALTQKQFVASDTSDALYQRIAVLEHSLQASEESLQSTIEELETTNEELMSVNEEMQSTNEELHSVNEELYTVSAEHQRKNDELVERETDILVLLSSSKIGTLHLDENLRLKRYTSNALSVFNILPQDISRPFHHITVRAKDQDILELVNSASQDSETHETQMTVDDSVYLLRIMPYENNEKSGKGVLITVIDISNIEQLKKAEHQNQLLQSANENLNQFAFIASHDLQEPLRKIQQFGSFLIEELNHKLTGESKYHLDVVIEASQRMSTLIYDLLSYSGASQEEPASEAVSLNTLLRDVQLELEISIAESDANIEVSDLPDIHGDQVLLRQLFVNLLSNSIKYCAEGCTPAIEVKSVKNGIEVADNGIGFDMEYCKKIFEPFQRLHNSDEYKGNGIGLAICSKVCEKHGWTLSAKSETGTGSRFIVDFNSQ